MKAKIVRKHEQASSRALNYPRKKTSSKQKFKGKKKSKIKALKEALFLSWRKTIPLVMRAHVIMC